MADEQAKDVAEGILTDPADCDLGNYVAEGILTDPADIFENGRGDPADRDLGARGQASFGLHIWYKYLLACYESENKKLEAMIAEWAEDPATKQEEVCEVNLVLAGVQKQLEEFKVETQQDEGTRKEGENEVSLRDSQ